MSGFQKLPHWFMREHPMDPYERLVYLTLRSHADKNGIAWPSRATLAKESGLSETTVKNRLKDLVDHGLVRVTVRPKKGAKHDPNLYHVLELHDDGPRHTVLFETQGASGDPTGGARRPHLGASDDHEEEPLEEEPEEEDLRLTQGASEHPALGTFIDPQEPATQEQLNYLSDLHVHMTNEAPHADRRKWWGDHTKQQASEIIGTYLRRMPRDVDYQGPEQGENSYNLLSPKGQEYADLYMLPEAS